jgi:hypothetical protein
VPCGTLTLYSLKADSSASVQTLNSLRTVGGLELTPQGFLSQKEPDGRQQLRGPEAIGCVGSGSWRDGRRLPRRGSRSPGPALRAPEHVRRPADDAAGCGRARDAALYGWREACRAARGEPVPVEAHAAAGMLAAISRSPRMPRTALVLTWMVARSLSVPPRPFSPPPSR